MTIETDIEVDFAPPKDFQESPSKLTREPSITSHEEQKQPTTVAGKAFPGSGQRLDSKKPIDGKQATKATASGAEEYDPRQHRLRHGIRPTATAGPLTHWEGLKAGRLLD